MRTEAGGAPAAGATAGAATAFTAADAEPAEVIPGARPGQGWTPELQAGFRAFHQARFGGLDGPAAEQGHAIVGDDEVLGAARTHEVLIAGETLAKKVQYDESGADAVEVLVGEGRKARVTVARA